MAIGIWEIESTKVSISEVFCEKFKEFLVTGIMSENSAGDGSSKLVVTSALAWNGHFKKRVNAKVNCVSGWSELVADLNEIIIRQGIQKKRNGWINNVLN